MTKIIAFLFYFLAVFVNLILIISALQPCSKTYERLYNLWLILFINFIFWAHSPIFFYLKINHLNDLIVDHIAFFSLCIVAFIVASKHNPIIQIFWTRLKIPLKTIVWFNAFAMVGALYSFYFTLFNPLIFLTTHGLWIITSLHIGKTLNLIYQTKDNDLSNEDFEFLLKIVCLPMLLGWNFITKNRTRVFILGLLLGAFTGYKLGLLRSKNLFLNTILLHKKQP